MCKGDLIIKVVCLNRFPHRPHKNLAELKNSQGAAPDSF